MKGKMGCIGVSCMYLGCVV